MMPPRIIFALIYINLPINLMYFFCPLWVESGHSEDFQCGHHPTYKRSYTRGLMVGVFNLLEMENYVARDKIDIGVANIAIADVIVSFPFSTNSKIFGKIVLSPNPK